MSISEIEDESQNEMNGESASNQTDDLWELSKDEKKIGEMIESLNESDVSSKEKLKTLNTLQNISIFSSILSTTKMPAYINALRGLLNDPDYDLRITAFDKLATMKDDVAQDMLVTELKSDKKEEEKLVPTHLAISMLGRDEKALDYELLENIAANPPNDESLVQAVRHLPINDSNFETLKKIMEDETRPFEARKMISYSYSESYPFEFLTSTENILNNNGLNDPIIPYAINDLKKLEKNGITKQVNDVRILMRTLATEKNNDANDPAILNFLLEKKGSNE